MYFDKFLIMTRGTKIQLSNKYAIIIILQIHFLHSFEEIVGQISNRGKFHLTITYECTIYKTMNYDKNLLCIKKKIGSGAGVSICLFFSFIIDILILEL